MMITQELLESDLSDDREQVLHLRVGDKGSLPHCVKMEVQGVHMYGIMDSGADITIIGARRSRRWLLRLNTRDVTLKNYEQKLLSCLAGLPLPYYLGPANTSMYVFPSLMYPYCRHPEGSNPHC